MSPTLQKSNIPMRLASLRGVFRSDDHRLRYDVRLKLVLASRRGAPGRDRCLICGGKREAPAADRKPPGRRQAGLPQGGAPPHLSAREGGAGRRQGARQEAGRRPRREAVRGVPEGVGRNPARQRRGAGKRRHAGHRGAAGGRDDQPARHSRWLERAGHSYTAPRRKMEARPGRATAALCFLRTKVAAAVHAWPFASFRCKAVLGRFRSEANID
jgi:hypothetical protein